MSRAAALLGSAGDEAFARQQPELLAEATYTRERAGPWSASREQPANEGNSGEAEGKKEADAAAADAVERLLLRFGGRHGGRGDVLRALEREVLARSAAAQPAGAAPRSSPASFAGRVCLVTGAGRGVGLAIALALAAAGATVAAVDADPAALLKAEQQLTTLGDAICFVADAADRLQLSEVVKQVQRKFTDVDILVAAQGLAKAEEERDWQAIRSGGSLACAVNSVHCLTRALQGAAGTKKVALISLGHYDAQARAAESVDNASVAQYAKTVEGAENGICCVHFCCSTAATPAAVLLFLSNGSSLSGGQTIRI